jgi:2-polyprenyl-3-methyl-5-hydroxy-6-metoxy-1,4-benzoquinol methylase
VLLEFEVRSGSDPNNVANFKFNTLAALNRRNRHGQSRATQQSRKEETQKGEAEGQSQLDEGQQQPQYQRLFQAAEVTDGARPVDPARTHAEHIASRVKLAGVQVLDVGCGNGQLMRELEGLGAAAFGLETDEAPAPAMC